MYVTRLIAALSVFVLGMATSACHDNGPQQVKVFVVTVPDDGEGDGVATVSQTLPALPLGSFFDSPPTSWECYIKYPDRNPPTWFKLDCNLEFVGGNFVLRSNLPQHTGREVRFVVWY